MVYNNFTTKLMKMNSHYYYVYFAVYSKIYTFDHVFFVVKKKKKWSFVKYFIVNSKTKAKIT